MLVIRKEQIQAMIAADETEFFELVRDAVAAAHPARVGSIPGPERDRVIKLGIERARSHQLKNAEDVAAFVSIMFAVAPRFDEQTDIARALANPDLKPELRFKLLFDTTSDEAWKEAETFYNESFWFSGPNAQ